MTMSSKTNEAETIPHYYEFGHIPQKRKKKAATEWFEGCTTCKECGKTFATKSSLEIHVRIHTGEKPYTCTACGKCFTQKGHIKRHILMHQDWAGFECKLCSKTFRDHRAFKRHQTTHLGFEYRFKCDFCNKTYTRLASLTFHKRIHNDAKYFKCKQCPEGFSSHFELRRHVADLHKKPFLRCEVCGKMYVHKCDLKIHSRSHSGDRPFACSFCDKMFKSVSHVNRHEKTHGNQGYVAPKSRVPPCEKCQRKFSTRSESILHHCADDSDLFPFNCALCDNGYVKKRDLIRHMLEHYPEKNPVRIIIVPSNNSKGDRGPVVK